MLSTSLAHKQATKVIKQGTEHPAGGFSASQVRLRFSLCLLGSYQLSIVLLFASALEETSRFQSHHHRRGILPSTRGSPHGVSERDQFSTAALQVLEFPTPEHQVQIVTLDLVLILARRWSNFLNESFPSSRRISQGEISPAGLLRVVLINGVSLQRQQSFTAEAQGRVSFQHKGQLGSLGHAVTWLSAVAVIESLAKSRAHLSTSFSGLE